MCMTHVGGDIYGAIGKGTHVQGMCVADATTIDWAMVFGSSKGGRVVANLPSMATMEQLMEMLVQQNQQLQQGLQEMAQMIGNKVHAAQTGFRGSEGDKRGFNDKVSSRVDNFDGQNWKERSQQFKAPLTRASHDADWLLEEMESQPQEVDLENIDIDDVFVGIDVGKWAAEVYDALFIAKRGPRHERGGVVEGGVPTVQSLHNSICAHRFHARNGAGPSETSPGLGPKIWTIGMSSLTPCGRTTENDVQRK